MPPPPNYLDFCGVGNMEPITKYILNTSKGKNDPVCGSQISKTLGISGFEVRQLINAARCKGDPICSCGRGYYIAVDSQEILKTIESLESRIAAMTKAKNGLQSSLNNPSFWSEAV